MSFSIPDFNLNLYPKIFRDHVQQVMEWYRLPKSLLPFVVTGTIASLGATIGPCYYFGNPENPIYGNLMLLQIGKSSCGKGASAGSSTRIMDQCDEKAYDLCREASASLDLSIKQLKRCKDSDVSTPEELILKEDAVRDNKLIKKFYANAGVTLSEFTGASLHQTLAQLRSVCLKGEELVKIYRSISSASGLSDSLSYVNELYHNGTVRKKLKGEDFAEVIHNPALCMFVQTVKEELHRVFKESHMESGCIARYIFSVNLGEGLLGLPETHKKLAETELEALVGAIFENKLKRARKKDSTVLEGGFGSPPIECRVGRGNAAIFTPEAFAAMSSLDSNLIIPALNLGLSRWASQISGKTSTNAKKVAMLMGVIDGFSKRGFRPGVDVEVTSDYVGAAKNFIAYNLRCQEYVVKYIVDHSPCVRKESVDKSFRRIERAIKELNAVGDGRARSSDVFRRTRAHFPDGRRAYEAVIESLIYDGSLDQVDGCLFLVERAKVKDKEEE